MNIITIVLIALIGGVYLYFWSVSFEKNLYRKNKKMQTIFLILLFSPLFLMTSILVIIINLFLIILGIPVSLIESFLKKKSNIFSKFRVSFNQIFKDFYEEYELKISVVNMLNDSLEGQLFNIKNHYYLIEYFFVLTKYGVSNLFIESKINDFKTKFFSGEKDVLWWIKEDEPFIGSDISDDFFE